jgi:hypothetical protein
MTLAVDNTGVQNLLQQFAQATGAAGVDIAAIVQQ